MSVAHRPLFAFEPSEFAELPGLSVRWQADPAPAPELLVLNDELAVELGADPAVLRGEDGIAVLSGNAVPEGTTPVAQAYAGHQFGGWSPRLGDGRALLLGEVVDVHGRRRDVHMKGSGRTPFARGGDGKAVVGPMLREYVIGEAMHALGVPTTRALAVVATGEQVLREEPLPGAVLTRVAASHLRVGTFQYAASLGDVDLVRRLVDHAIARHHPHLAGSDRPAAGLLDAVVDVQAALVARWMLVGFVHGVMNTDNMTISGETIDYGPCAFMDAHDAATVFSSIDVGGRYAYGNQPRIAHWNLARLAEALLAVLDDEPEAAIERGNDILRTFPARFETAWRAGMRAKLGLADAPAADQLADDLAALLDELHPDHTSTFRALAGVLRGDGERIRALAGPGLDPWLDRWRAELAAAGRDERAMADAMDRVNPVYVPRNHLVEEALELATVGDLTAVHRLVAATSQPFDERPGFERYAEPAPPSFGRYRTFCGT